MNPTGSGSRSASENDSTRAVRDTARDNKHRTITGATRRLFRDAVKAITRRAEDDPPKPRRRRTGITDRIFGLAARATVRRAVRLPAAAFTAAIFLHDTLDWLNLWHHDTASSSELNDSLHAVSNHLSHRL